MLFKVLNVNTHFFSNSAKLSNMIVTHANNIGQLCNHREGWIKYGSQRRLQNQLVQLLFHPVL